MKTNSQQRIVLDAVRRAPGPRSANDLWESLRRNGTRISLPTVYRALRSGVDSGALVSIELPGGGLRYEPADRPHHHHFLCSVCDDVYDVEGCVAGLKKLLPKNFEMTGHEILFFGTCAGCKATA